MSYFMFLLFVFLFLARLNPKSSVYFNLQYVSVWPSHILSAQEPHMTSDEHLGKCRLKVKAGGRTAEGVIRGATCALPART